MSIHINDPSDESRGSPPALERVVTRSNLLVLIGRLAETRQLIGPVAHFEPDCTPPVRCFYEPVESANRLALDFGFCVYGPKSVLFPPRETLFQFNRSDGRFETVPLFDERPKALVGVHPCDLHAIRLLDAVFERDTRDEHYAARRERLFVVGVDCAAPCTDGVFCRDMDTNQAESGFDAMLYPLDRHAGRPNDTPAEDRYGVVFGSAAGRRWFDEAPELSSAPDESQRRDFRAYLTRKSAAFPSALGMGRDAAASLVERSYRSPIWESEATACYSCGSCNLACPTCYCFDIQDENDLPADSGRRERSWDGCMLREFALVAGGHNFRSQAAQRLRHRILRKMSWIERRTGLPGCVGCARCDRACTARISMVDIMHTLAREPRHVNA